MATFAALSSRSNLLRRCARVVGRDLLLELLEARHGNRTLVLGRTLFRCLLLLVFRSRDIPVAVVESAVVRGLFTTILDNASAWLRRANGRVALVRDLIACWLKIEQVYNKYKHGLLVNSLSHSGLIRAHTLTNLRQALRWS